MVENPCGCGHDVTQHEGGCICCLCTEFHGDQRLVPALINERWTITLPEHRAYRSEWPVWEKERLASMHDLLVPGDVIYDVGAEEGDMPALFATWGCGVVMVEPNPKVWPCIRACWEANDLPAPLGWWVGFASDVTELQPPRLDIDATERGGWPECAYGPLIPWHGFRHLYQQTDATPQMTIDDLAERFGAPTAITMDIEGSELHALRGARGVLEGGDIKVWVSVHPPFLDEMYGQSREDVLDYMAGLGYGAELLATDHEEHWLFLRKP